MGSIPLPALDLKPVQQPDVMAQMGNLYRLKAAQQQLANAPLETQALQQQVQSGQLGIQQQQMQMESSRALMNAGAKLDPTDPQYFDKFIKNAQATGKVMPQQLQGIMNAAMEWRTKAATLNETQQKVYQNLGDSLHSIGTQYLQQSDQQMAQNWPTVRDQIGKIEGMAGADPSQIPPQFPGRDWVQAHTLMAGMSAAGLRAAAAQQQAETGQQRLAASMNPQSSLYAPTPAAVALGTAPGAQQIQQNAVTQAAKKAGAEAAARQPYEMALARQRQALSQGDPNAAAQLLVDGDATLAELKSRGATPDFIARALFGAKRLSGGKYNAQAADAQFDVAKSPANVAFFGSAKSLTDPGGTLDQLAKVAKDLPAGQLPALNSLADWEKAATGTGPIAHYAATALGVADDYAKVMGGGQGSDTSRLQALNLIAPKQSPEMRAGSIQGIHDAVMSQATSRIGKNPVLQRMYGDEFHGGNATNGSATPTNGLTVVAPNGKHYTFKDQASADAFRKAAGIQ